MLPPRYAVQGVGEIPSPALLYYKDLIAENMEKAVAIAGDPARLWPHVKTHKTRELLSMLIARGVTKFKCATIAEAEVAASCGPSDVLLAYPLVGPNISRFLALSRAYPDVRFFAVGDDLAQLALLGEQARALGITVPLLIDVNVGMDRTGVPISGVAEFSVRAAALPGLAPMGLHCYDGHIHQPDRAERERLAAAVLAQVLPLRGALESRGLTCSILVMGGTPTFPCYAKTPGLFLSPGTVFVSDHGYGESYPDLDFTPAGLLLTRVISRPTAETFTLDLGSKAIAADPAGVRGIIAGLEDAAVPLFQNEEHWVFRALPGQQARIPAVGEELAVIPTHICPTTALYPAALVVEDGRITGSWEIAARNRRLRF